MEKVLYLCRRKLEDMESLKVRLGYQDRKYTFDEWVDKCNVGSLYVDCTRYFGGNPSCGVRPITTKETFIRKFLRFLFN
jgi:hypothetical protein